MLYGSDGEETVSTCEIFAGKYEFSFPAELLKGPTLPASLQYTQGVSLLSGFTYPNICNQKKVITKLVNNLLSKSRVSPARFHVRSGIGSI